MSSVYQGRMVHEMVAEVSLYNAFDPELKDRLNEEQNLRVPLALI